MLFQKERPGACDAGALESGSAGWLISLEFSAHDRHDQAFRRRSDKIFESVLRHHARTADERVPKRQPRDYGAAEEALMRRARRIRAMALHFPKPTENWDDEVARAFPEASRMQRVLTRKLAIELGRQEGRP